MSLDETEYLLKLIGQDDPMRLKKALEDLRDELADSVERLREMAARANASGFYVMEELPRRLAKRSKWERDLERVKNLPKSVREQLLKELFDVPGPQDIDAGDSGQVPDAGEAAGGEAPAERGQLGGVGLENGELGGDPEPTMPQ